MNLYMFKKIQRRTNTVKSKKESCMQSFTDCEIEEFSTLCIHQYDLEQELHRATMQRSAYTNTRTCSSSLAPQNLIVAKLLESVD